MNLVEKLVSYRIKKVGVLFKCADLDEKRDCIKRLLGLGFEKEMMFDCMAKMNSALYVGIRFGFEICVYVCPTEIFYTEQYDWEDFLFEFS